MVPARLGGVLANRGTDETFVDMLRTGALSSISTVSALTFVIVAVKVFRASGMDAATTVAIVSGADLVALLEGVILTLLASFIAIVIASSIWWWAKSLPTYGDKRASRKALLSRDHLTAWLLVGVGFFTIPWPFVLLLSVPLFLGSFWLFRVVQDEGWIKDLRYGVAISSIAVAAVWLSPVMGESTLPWSLFLVFASALVSIASSLFRLALPDRWLWLNRLRSFLPGISITSMASGAVAVVWITLDVAASNLRPFFLSFSLPLISVAVSELIRRRVLDTSRVGWKRFCFWISLVSAASAAVAAARIMSEAGEPAIPWPSFLLLSVVLVTFGLWLPRPDRRPTSVGVKRVRSWIWITCVLVVIPNLYLLTLSSRVWLPLRQIDVATGRSIELNGKKLPDPFAAFVLSQDAERVTMLLDEPRAVVETNAKDVVAIPPICIPTPSPWRWTQLRPVQILQIEEDPGSPYDVCPGTP